MIIFDIWNLIVDCRYIARDVSSLNVSHLSSEDYDLTTAETTIFSSNGSCVLSPEVTEGPYYVAGEYIREDVTETQAGVDLTLDLQVLDIDTCEPVEGAYTEIWRESCRVPPNLLWVSSS